MRFKILATLLACVPMMTFAGTGGDAKTEPTPTTDYTVFSKTGELIKVASGGYQLNLNNVYAEDVYWAHEPPIEGLGKIKLTEFISDWNSDDENSFKNVNPEGSAKLGKFIIPGVLSNPVFDADKQLLTFEFKQLLPFQEGFVVGKEYNSSRVYIDGKICPIC